MRMRRLRSTAHMRNMMSETPLSTDHLVLPLFFDESIDKVRMTGSLPGVPTYPLNRCREVAETISEKGIKAVMIFGIPKRKDPTGSSSYSEDGVVQKAVRMIKDRSDLIAISDLCMCEYTDHGHCGILSGGRVDNDATLEVYGKIAVSLASAGSDMVAPSGMMDNQVASIRDALDGSGNKDTMIMAYSAKFCSSFYGPFRDIAHSAPSEGDRSTYQMQCGNRREAMREIRLDIEEGADIIMVKPAMPYLDIIRDARNEFDIPIAAYQVSGEYSMIKAAAEKGWIDEDRMIMESLTSIKRAGSDIMITYYAERAAEILGGMK